jgi:hypothetical protein
VEYIQQQLKYHAVPLLYSTLYFYGGLSVAIASVNMPLRLMRSAVSPGEYAMKALTYHGPHHVSVDTMPDPALEAPDDIILRVTATAICGSDLHLYRGKIPGTHHGDIFGHEFMGEVVEAGSEVTAVRKGDRVVIPFVIACGDCFFVACSSMPPAKAPIAARGDAQPKRHFATGGAVWL